MVSIKITTEWGMCVETFLSIVISLFSRFSDTIVQQEYSQFPLVEMECTTSLPILFISLQCSLVEMESTTSLCTCSYTKPVNGQCLTWCLMMTSSAQHIRVIVTAAVAIMVQDTAVLLQMLLPVKTV